MSLDPLADSTPEATDSLPSLGSLAKSVHVKQLKVARTILIIVGIVVMLVNALRIANTNTEVEQELQAQIKVLHNQGMQEDSSTVADFRARATRICYLIYGSFIVLGIVYMVLGLLVRAFPVPATVLGLVLYIGSTAILGFLNPLTLVNGWIWKILIIAGLAKSIQAAVAYSRG